MNGKQATRRAAVSMVLLLGALLVSCWSGHSILETLAPMAQQGKLEVILIVVLAALIVLLTHNLAIAMTKTGKDE